MSFIKAKREKYKQRNVYQVSITDRQYAVVAFNKQKLILHGETKYSAKQCKSCFNKIGTTCMSHV